MKNLAPQGLNGGTFDVVAYGADSSGTNDSTAAVNAAITAANTWAGSSGKRAVVHFPAGSYLIQGRVEVKANIVIWAHGAYIYGGTDYNEAGNAGSIMFNTATNGVGYTGGVDNVTVIGGIWDAKGQNATAGGVRDIFCVSNCRTWTFENCVFRNVVTWHALDVNSVDGLIVSNCRFEGFVNQGDVSRNDSEMVQLDTGADGTPCKNVVVANCSAGPATDGSGLGGPGKLVGSHTPTNANTGFHTNIRISDNYCVDSAGCAIQGYDWSNVSITGNTLVNAQGDSTIKFYGQVTGTAERITVTGNVIDGIVARGIYFSDQGSTGVGFSGCIVQGNTIEGAGTNGAIYLEYFSEGVVDGNTIVQTGTTSSSHGIFSDVCTDTVCTNNTIKGHATSGTAGGAGIQWQASTRCKLSGNKIYGMPRHGIWMSGINNDPVCTDNYVFGAGREAGTYYGIYSGGSANVNPVVRSNVVRPFGSGNEVTHGIRVISTNTGVVCCLNDVGSLTIDDISSSRGTAEDGIAIPFHIAGSASTGVKTPEFIAPVAMRVIKLYARAASGSGSALRPSKNGGTGDGTILSSIGTTAVTNAQGVDLAAGDRLGVNVTTAGTGSDISATFWAILR